MRQLRYCERGSANWPFIIALILLLAFVYLWYDANDKVEGAQQAEQKAAKELKAANNAARVFRNYAEQISAKVGWVAQPARDLFKPQDGLTGAEKDADDFDVKMGQQIAGSVVLTNLDQLVANLSTDGTMSDGSPGLVKFLTEAAQVGIVKSIRSQASEDVPETAANFEWMTPEFKEKLAEIAQMEIPAKPVPPADSDDLEAKGEYERALEEFENAVAAYEAALDELQQMEGWNKWDSIIKPPRRFSPDQREIVVLDFFTQTLAGDITVEKAMRYPKEIIPAIIGELKRNKEADASIIADQAAQVQARQDSIDQLETDLSDEQTRHTTDVEDLQGRLATANETAESNRLQATEALQAKQVVEEDMRREVSKLDSQINALRDRVRGDKEVRDLKIRRDDIDGQILAASPTMGTAIIDMGSNDKIYPGLKFRVSYIGKGGHRLPKGEVMVTRVLGPHSAKVTVLAELPGNPVGQGDLLTNALFSAKDQIHIWLAGELEKYPKDILLARLAKMGVIVDAQINGDTDYVVVPNSMAAPAPSAGGEDEEDEEEGPAVGKSEYEKVENLARTFGATVITEKMLNAFLDY